MAADYLHLNEYITYFAYGLAIAQIPFIVNFFISAKVGKKVENDNPWNATTLEWATPTPPGHGNFLTEPAVYRNPYEYSVPGDEADFTPQFEADPKKAATPKKAEPATADV
jgi:cytochrome c oxidase subunit 1